jgi:hypothetical protein
MVRHVSDFHPFHEVATPHVLISILNHVLFALLTRIAVVVCMGLSTIINLFVVSRRLQQDKNSPTRRASQSLVRLLRNLLVGHILAWGTTFLWRVGRAMHPPPSWSTNPKSTIVQLVVFNAAGAGYIDVLVRY